MSQSRTASEALEKISDTEERVLVATSRYLGEGVRASMTGGSIPCS
jgi:hypothetical protein